MIQTLNLTSRHILSLDNDFVVINKPAGLATHPGLGCPGDVTCLGEVRRLMGKWVYPVHRLDRPTSGALMFALKEESASILSQAFANQMVSKQYLAIVRGHLAGGGTISKPLTHLTTGTLQPAETRYECLSQTDMPWPVRPYDSSRYSLVSLRPTTGRTHQLRRHLSSLSHPIIGDTRYGDGAHNQALRLRLGTNRLFLHAMTLSFQHPRTGQPVHIEAPMDHEWLSAKNFLFSDFNALSCNDAEVKKDSIANFWIAP